MHVRHDVNVKCLLQGGCPPCPPLKKGQKKIGLSFVFSFGLSFHQKKRQKKALAKARAKKNLS